MADEIPQPSTELGLYELSDDAGKKLRVAASFTPGLIAISATGVLRLTPDQADQAAGALKAHAGARRAEALAGEQP